MSSTVPATTSPPTRFKFQSNAATAPPVFEKNNRTILTTSFRAAGASDGSTPGGGEPPAKRPRLDDSDRLDECLKAQVFPHIFRHLDALREAGVPGDKILGVGREFISLLTAPGSEFSQEYHSRDTGRISAALEARIAARLPGEIRTLLSRPNIENTPSEDVIRNDPARTSTPKHSSSPIPPPIIPQAIRHLDPAKESVRKAAFISTSPIPIPRVPHLPPTRVQKADEPNKAVVKGPRDTTRQPETIVIDDESADEVERALQKRSPPARSSIVTRAFAPSWRNAAASLLTPRKPYILFKDRAFSVSYAHSYFDDKESNLVEPVTLHVDFSSKQLNHLNDLACKVFPSESRKKKKDGHVYLTKLLKNKKLQDVSSRLLDAWEADPERAKLFLGRERIDVDNLFKDLKNRQTNNRPASMVLRKDDVNEQGKFLRESRIPSLLFAREIVGSRGYGRMRRPQNFHNEIRKCREDELALRAEWAGGAGDIITITWVSDDGFICGTTEHSDAHNQEYNKPGNLALGSCSLKTLRGYSDHRVVRPIVDKGVNSTDAMRQSQDHWLYSSVVSSTYDASHDRLYTSGFDCCVKIWKADPSGASMSLIGEWEHDGNVNFVVGSKHDSGMVATAADVAAGAVRIYMVSEENVSGSSFGRLSCSRVTDERGNLVSTEKWAYYPATMQWGIAKEVQHLLLVGYSPRSRTGEDLDIPEDRKNSGELCLWDGLTGKRLNILSAEKSNVFEVLWHPSQACFIAATSPSGLDLEPKTRTQIRIFRPTDPAEDGTAQYSSIKVLDCPALDINELTIMPNSAAYCYVTAGCTNGKVYVWDTAPGRGLVHLLEHGEPVDPYEGDREKNDVGVKFTAWGTSLDRFYTGSSDGIVKAWNIRSLDKPLVRVLLEAPAPVSCGMFSPEKSRLVVGDASGRVFVLSIHEDDFKPPLRTELKLPGGGKRIVEGPNLINRHPEPPRPLLDAAGRLVKVEPGSVIARAYLADRQLTVHRDEAIGAVQGPTYSTTGLYCAEAHLNGDPNGPLLANWERHQREAAFRGRSSRRRDLRLRPIQEQPGLQEQHLQNLGNDIIDWDALPAETKAELEGEVDFELLEDYIFPYQEELPEMEQGSEGEDMDEL
ncbi:hypothetical protein QBC40DRAFT_341864 [Triangularia verruculosa]|uniref:Uncharacterized protein n=1 Tax=Triangularia verruculosa TaxID=2587418 RepID=A0AAN6XBR8_9PEZI|nr:hypothetical protein QBC40DRAFT_341864 [Triangularia verruculosa]